MVNFRAILHGDWGSLWATELVIMGMVQTGANPASHGFRFQIGAVALLGHVKKH